MAAELYRLMVFLLLGRLGSCSSRAERLRLHLRAGPLLPEVHLVELELEPANPWVDLDLSTPGHSRQRAG